MLSGRQSIPYIWSICQSHCPAHSELIPLAQVQYDLEPHRSIALQDRDGYILVASLPMFTAALNRQV